MADVATEPAASAPAATEGQAAPPAAPASYDWKTAGLDDGGMAFVTERQFKGPGDLLTSYRQLDSAFGVPPDRLIKLPAPRDAGDPKAWDPIFTKLGRPETADKYVLPIPEGDKGEFANAVKPWLHEAGISQSAATKLATKWNEFITQTKQTETSQTEARNVTEIAQLKQEWGGEFDQKLTIVDRAAETFGMTQPHLDALKSALGPKAAMQFLYNIGSKVAVEDTTVPGMDGKGTGFGGTTPEMARAKIAEYSKPGSGFAQLMESKDPKQRMEAHAEWNKLHVQANPPEPTPRA